MAATTQLAEIEHFVVLMLENRSFDHMLGFLYADRGNVSLSGQPFEGLTGHESNAGPDGAVSVFEIAPHDANAYFMPGADPGEGYSATNSQLFGTPSPPAASVATNQGFVTDFSYTLGWQAKEPGWSILPGTVASNIMGIYSPAMLPILSGLARGFAVCDHWFASVPTETLPNRAFACAATSQGHVDDKTKSFTAPSIFELLSKHGLSWSIFGYDAEPLTRLSFTDTTNAPEAHFGRFSDFQTAAVAGNLAAYTFLEPAWGAGGNSQHPNYDIALGEQLIHDVYYALRNGPVWSKTLLIITYDEHGGCYDHVPPPAGAAPPDHTVGQFGFDFRRFGVRVPTVLVSPWIAPGSVFRVPAGTTPLDHTSTLRTVENRWGLPPLTARDAAASDVSGVISLAGPRQDDPIAGVEAHRSGGSAVPVQGPSHLQQVQAELVAQLPVPDGRGGTHHVMPHLTTSEEYSVYIQSRTMAWKAARRSSS